MFTKDHTKLVLLFALLLSVFLNKINVSKKLFNTILMISIVLLAFSIMHDLMIGLLFVSIAYVVFSKLSVKEKFSEVSKKNMKNVETVKNTNKKEAKKHVDQKSKKVQKTNDLPEHCSKINSINDEFIKEFELSAKNLDDVQNNVFDKYNYNVFYNELGENSLDIQGIFNHEVNGYEKSNTF